MCKILFAHFYPTMMFSFHVTIVKIEERLHFTLLKTLARVGCQGCELTLKYDIPVLVYIYSCHI